MGAEEDAETFWQQHLAGFQSVNTSFDRICEAGDIAVLEWTVHATLVSGRPVRYAGVSLLTFERDAIVRYAAYYDTPALATAATGP